MVELATEIVEIACNPEMSDADALREVARAILARGRHRDHRRALLDDPGDRRQTARHPADADGGGRDLAGGLPYPLSPGLASGYAGAAACDFRLAALAAA